jgi:hypothetical protein
VITPSVTAVTPGAEKHNAVRLQLLGLPVSLLPPHAAQGVQVDQDVDEGVEVGDGLAIAQPGALDAEFLGLGIDALGSRALVVDFLVDVAVTIDLVADTCADAGCHRSDAALGPVLVLDGAGLTGGFGKDQRASIAAALVFDTGGFAGEGEFERHGEPGLAQWQAGRI